MIATTTSNSINVKARVDADVGAACVGFTRGDVRVEGSKDPNRPQGGSRCFQDRPRESVPFGVAFEASSYKPRQGPAARAVAHAAAT